MKRITCDLALVGITPCIDSVEEQVAGELLDECMPIGVVTESEHAESEEISVSAERFTEHKEQL
jgi:hypothetical protein